jgi:hypothetical protein
MSIFQRIALLKKEAKLATIVKESQRKFAFPISVIA